MNSPAPRPALPGALMAILLGVVGGAVLVFFSMRDAAFDGTRDQEIEIRINGVEGRMSRDVLLPASGWVLQIRLPPELSPETRDSLSVTLRAEHTGAMIEIADQLVSRDGIPTLVIPESLGLFEGLLSIRATLRDAQARELVAYRRVRIRSWLGGPPIGSRQIVHFDFEVDRDGDGRPDFERDLERFGLATPEHPELARRVAAQLARRALARVERAYDDPSDPNGTGFERDQVFVRWLLDVEPGPFVTRICVGGRNRAHPGSVGNVRFDHRNERRSSDECEGEEAAGLFPAELVSYAESPLYQEVLRPFLGDAGGRPFGGAPGDDRLLDAVEVAAAADGGASPAVDAARGRQLAVAIRVMGDALGTVMAHESAHALGLVPEGRPGVGLFGGSQDAGRAYAHNLDAEGARPADPWLMNVGTSFSFEQLAGEGEAGELRFRPLNYAYLKDRVVLIDGRRSD